MATVYGYPAREDIVAGQTYTVTIPHISRDKRFADVVKLVKGIGEYQGSTASYDEATKTWTVTLAADAKGALDDLRLAEAKYGADVVQIPGDHGYAQASADHAAISATPAADPFANIPNADDSLNGEFSPAATPAPKTRDRSNWELLRSTVERDLAVAKSHSTQIDDPSDNRAHAYQLVLDSMDVFEFGLEYWRAKMQAESVPGLAEHTQAACDTITKAAE